MNRDRYRFIGLVVALAGCDFVAPDPVRENLEDEQGPEDPAIPQGEEHRAGQRCLACHRDGGEGPEFSFAGTVYTREGGSVAAKGVDIVVRDARGEEWTATSNRKGNFYVRASEWKPVFPLTAKIGGGLSMLTEIPREGSCNACHRGEGDQTHMPGIYVEEVR